MKPTLLVVDDDAMVRGTLQKILELAGYQVEAASSGEDALEIFSKKPVGMAIVDILMPGMSGLELIEKLRRVEPDVKIIAVSGVDCRANSR